LKDIVDVTIRENSKSSATFQFMCPISQTEFNGLNKFILLWSCGCIISEKAFLETKEKSKNKCILCNKNYSKDDIISLNMGPLEQEKIKNEIIKIREEKVNCICFSFEDIIFLKEIKEISKKKGKREGNRRRR